MDRLSEVFFTFHGRYGKKEVVANVLPGKVIVWGLKINGIFIGSLTTGQTVITQSQAIGISNKIRNQQKRK